MRIKIKLQTEKIDDFELAPYEGMEIYFQTKGEVFLEFDL